MKNDYLCIGNDKGGAFGMLPGLIFLIDGRKVKWKEVL